MVSGVLTLVSGSITTVISSITTVSGVFTMVSGVLTPVSGSITTVISSITTVSGAFAMVNGVLTPVSGSITMVIISVTMVSGVFTMVNGALTPVSGPLTVVSPALPGGRFAFKVLDRDEDNRASERPGVVVGMRVDQLVKRIDAGAHRLAAVASKPGCFGRSGGHCPRRRLSPGVPNPVPEKIRMKSSETRSAGPVRWAGPSFRSI